MMHRSGHRHDPLRPTESSGRGGATSVRSMEPSPPSGPPHAVRHPSGMWEDAYGALGPAKPGLGPRQDPTSEFPTGPAVGERLPDIVAPDQHGDLVDVHTDRAGRPAVVVFYRSAVW